MVKKLLLLFGLLIAANFGFAQSDIETLEDQLDKIFGVEKLNILNQLSKQYQVPNIRKAIKYGKQAVDLAESLYPNDSIDSAEDQYFLKVDAYNLLGEAQYLKENYYDAQINFKSALAISLNSDYQPGFEMAEDYLIKLDSIGVKSNVFKEKFRDIKLGRTINAESKDLTLSYYLKTAQMNEGSENYEKAIRNYEKAVGYLKDKGDDEQIAELYRRIAENYNKLGNISKSLEYYDLAIGEKEKLGDTTGLQASREGIDDLQGQIEELIIPKEVPVDTVKIKEEVKTRDDYITKAIEAQENEDYEKSLEYYKLYTALNEQMAEDEKQQQMALLEKSHQIERNLQQIQLLTQYQEISDLELVNKENEIKLQDKFRKNLIVGLVLLVSLAIALYLLYANKRRDHKRLNAAHQELKATQEKLIAAEQRIKILLGQQLSTDVANALLSESTEDKIQRKLACVMFLDIRGFTTFAESKNPEEIIQFQNDVFGFMIDSVYKHHGTINQFLGDGFMATFGAPVSTGNDSQNAVNASIEIIAALKQKASTGQIPETKVGIGLHTGYIVTGNVGTAERMQYSITGNTVILAARIEQLNKKFNSALLISKDVLERLDMKNLKSESLGDVNLKGRAEPMEIIKLV